MEKWFVAAKTVLLLLMLPLAAKADVVVRTSDELRMLLGRDADLGTVWLDGDEFDVSELTVKAGGTVRPYGSRKPVFVGKRVKLDKKQTQVALPNRDFVVTAVNGEAYPVAQSVLSVSTKQISRMDSVNRHIRIDFGTQMPASLRGKSKADLSHCTLKLSFWFLCMNVIELSSDNRYVYGTMATDYDYGKLGAKYYDFATLCFYNVPSRDEAVSVDGHGVAHVADVQAGLTLHLCSRGLTLEGKRQLTFEDVAFVGLSEPVTIKTVTAANKSFRRCTFRHCGRGIYCNNGLRNVPANILVTDCSFTDMYGSECVYLCGCDNTVIAGNTTHRTGLLNKGGAVLMAAGDNVHIYDNRLSSMSYIGIRFGNTRQAGQIRIAGRIERNSIDNIDYVGHSEYCLTDGGGIYVYTHQNATVVRDNVVCNMGFAKGDIRGIFMDDGAYNTTIEGNLIFNITGSYCIDSRQVKHMAGIDIAHHNTDNHFSHNVCLGLSRIHGNDDATAKPTTLSGNFVTVEGIKTDKGIVWQSGTQTIEAKAGGNGIIVERSTYRRLQRRLSKYVMQYVSTPK